ncbi:MAG: GNAT family N-acetyltransferase [Chitinophagaceae bacterium]|nr:GNAT family N-acetyltransferase [Chitinophagaceae bacterium]
MITVETAGTESIPAIQELAQKTWAVAYASILPPEQMSYMLDLFYSNEALQQQMQRGHRFILALEENVPAGFASFSPKMIGDEDPGTSSKTIFRLHKLYVDPIQQGKGIGKLLLDHIIQAIKPLGATELELNVNRSNPAISFYKKNGFSITREEDIDIGNGYFMNDYVMRKKPVG